MKTHTSSFKENIAKFGKELDSKIIYEQDGETIELGSEQLNSITPHYEGAILKSVMKQLDIDSNVEIPVGTILRYQFGLKVGNEYEYIDFGNYIVKSVEKQEDTRSWKITCYDKMLYAMKDYENSDITFPITIRDYINTICEKVGLVFANESEQFANYDKVISNELYLDSDGRSLGYTFRDVLDELAEVTASTICINKDDELEIRYIKDVGELTNVSGIDLTLETDSEVQLDNFELEGKTTQETSTQGKNICPTDFNEWESGQYDTSGNKDNNPYRIRVYRLIPVKPNTTYFFSTFKYPYNFVVRTYGSTKTFISSIGAVANNGTITTGSNVYYLGVSIWNSNNEANETYSNYQTLFSNGTLKPFICLNSENDKTYEVFTPNMPSPDYPSDLVSVGYENLFDSNITPENYFYNASGVKTYDANYTYINQEYDNINFTSLCISFLQNVGSIVRVCEYNSNNVFIKRTLLSQNGASLTLDGNTTKIILSVNSSSSYYFTNLQIEKGTKPHSYIPYGKYGIEVKTTGKNLFDKDSMVLNAFINAGNSQLASSNDFRTIYVPIKPSTTYTLQKIVSNRFIIGYSNTNYSIPQALTNISTYSTDRTELTFTTPNNVKYVFIMVSKITDDTTNITNLLNSIQLEENTQKTTYEEYKSNTYLYTLDNPLRSIGNIKDLAYIKNGMLYVDRKIKTVILNGTESWTHFSVAQGHLFRLDSIATDVIQNNNAIPMSNYYHAIAYSQQPNRTNNDIYISLIGQIDILNNNYTNVNDFKTWLSTHNTEVQYVLKVPYTEELGSVETPSTYEGITYLNAPNTTNVSYVSETDTIDEEYLKDVNVNFGEKFGKVNTLVLSRGGDGDKIALSIPSDLDDDDKVAIQITDNQIMNDNNRADYMQAILNQLNGLEYYINDFSSTGICYYDLCDRYQVKIGENVYKCIMFNDEVDITQGLEEFIYTDMQEENEQEYKYMSSDDRGITQANVIAKKNEGSIQEITQKIIGDNGLEARVGRVETTQTATERTINVISENITYQYDEQGNPISSDINSVKTTTGFTFNADGLTIANSQTNFIALHDNTGTYYKEGNEVIGQYTKDGSKQKDLQLFGVYYYGMSDINDTPMFVAQLYTDENGEECFGHFFNRGD